MQADTLMRETNRRHVDLGKLGARMKKSRRIPRVSISTSWVTLLGRSLDPNVIAPNCLTSVQV